MSAQTETNYERLIAARKTGRFMPLDMVGSTWVEPMRQEPNLTHSWAEGVQLAAIIEEERFEELTQLFLDWSPQDRWRIVTAEANKDTKGVFTGLVRIQRPSDYQDTRTVMLIAAQGFITAAGVKKIREAMKVADEFGMPIFHLNAITSADFMLEAEVNQIARQVSETMVTACKLTVPKVSYIVGEAASAGAHAGLHLLDQVQVTDRGLLTVIRPEAAFELLSGGRDVARLIRKGLRETLPAEQAKLAVYRGTVDMIREQGFSTDLLKDLVEAREDLVEESGSEVMLIMAASEGRRVRGMYGRGADSITLQTDDLEKQFATGEEVKLVAFLDALASNWQRAVDYRETEEQQPEIFLRITPDLQIGGELLWSDETIKAVLDRFSPLGLTGIRLTPESSTTENVIRMADLGVGQICLSVESDKEFDGVEAIVASSDRVTKVVMGVKDFMHNTNSNPNQVLQAKKRLIGILPNIKVLFSCIASYKDRGSLLTEVAENQELGAGGVLVIGPEQAPWAKAVLNNIVDVGGNLTKEILKETDTEGLYRTAYLQAYREIMSRIVIASHIDPESLLESGLVDSIVGGDDTAEAILEHLFKALAGYDGLSKEEIYRGRHQRLAQLAEQVLVKRESMDLRPGKVYQEIVCKLIDDPDDFQPIGNDLYPQVPTDVLRALGRVTTMDDLLQESQQLTSTPAGIVAGFEKINGQKVLLIARDPEFVNATAGASTGAVVRQLCQEAIKYKNDSGENLTVVYIDTSAGGRVQEGVYALLPSELAVEGMLMAKQAGIKFINVANSYVLGSDAIGPFYQGDHLIVLGKNTQLGLAGERLIFASSPLGSKEFPPGFRRGEYHLKMRNIDALVESVEELKIYLGKILPLK